MKYLKKSIGKKNKVADKAAAKVAALLLSIQNQFARKMNKLVANIPGKKLKVGIILFFIVSGSYSLYLIFQSIVQPDNKIIKISNMKVPQHVIQKVTVRYENPAIVNDDMYQQIQIYKHYMDSLGVLIRPGLMDSIHMLEEIYQSQK